MTLVSSLLETLVDNLSTTLIFLAILLLLWQLLKPSQYHLPPGPREFPILGNTFERILKIAEIGDDNAYDMYKKYKSPIMYLNFFGFRTIILHKYELIKELFSNEDFVNRPVTSLDKYAFKGIIDISGPRWKEQRRFALSTLRDFGLGKNKIELKILEEISSELFAELDSTDGKPNDVNNIMIIAISNIISSMVFGHRFEYKDKQFTKMVQLQNENNVHLRYVFLGGLVPFCYIPEWIPGDLFHKKKMLENLANLRENIIKPEFQQHMENYDPDNINDFTDAFIKEMKHQEADGNTDHWFTEEQLMYNIEDLFMAGTETTSTTMRWLLLRMVRHPDIQEHVRRDIHNAIGRERLPSMKDKLLLPYVEAVLLESQRMHAVVPFGISHCYVGDGPVPFKGYTFPPKSTAVASVYTLHFDPDNWQDPHTFNPDRFIDQDGKFQKDEKVFTFSVGKRSCLGESLAKQELFLFFTSLMQRYKLTLPPGDPLPSLDRVQGLLISPKPYKICLIKD